MKRFTDTDKWRDSWFQQLKPEYKLALIYLYDTADHAGVFDPNLHLADFSIGQAIDWKGFRDACGKRITVLKNGKWFIGNFVDFQYGELSEHCKPHHKVIKLLQSHGISKGYIQRVSDTLEEEDKEEDKDKDKDKDKKGQKSPSQIRAEALFGKRSSTPWDRAELKAWQAARAVVEATTDDEWALLEALHAAPESKERPTYRRTSLATCLNNWSAEITRARKWAESALEPHLNQF